MQRGFLRKGTSLKVWMGKTDEHLNKKKVPKAPPIEKDPNAPRTFWVRQIDLGDRFGMGQAVESDTMPIFGSGWIKCIEAKD